MRGKEIAYPFPSVNERLMEKRAIIAWDARVASGNKTVIGDHDTPPNGYPTALTYELGF
jgi:hypothetical protein